MSSGFVSETRNSLCILQCSQEAIYTWVCMSSGHENHNCVVEMSQHSGFPTISVYSLLRRIATIYMFTVERNYREVRYYERVEFVTIFIRKMHEHQFLPFYHLRRNIELNSLLYNWTYRRFRRAMICASTSLPLHEAQSNWPLCLLLRSQRPPFWLAICALSRKPNNTTSN